MQGVALAHMTDVKIRLKSLEVVVSVSHTKERSGEGMNGSQTATYRASTQLFVIVCTRVQAE